MSFNQYYQEELMALRELGREFSRRNPALAPFLDTPGHDPDVERILEGFSFLTGRLRQKLQDELPEITHSLFNLLWPNYLRPIPAASIIRYRPGDNVSGAVHVPRGTLVESVEVNGLRCRFRTVYDTEIVPLRLTDHRFLEQDGQGVLALRFASTGPPLENIPLSRLRFFITGESAVAHTIFFYMVNKVRQVRLVVRDVQEGEHMAARLGAEAVRGVGFLEEEGMYPYPANTFPGYRILQEYFCFPEKFHFVEVSGLEAGLHPEVFKAAPGAREFELHFAFSELPDMYETFRTDNWQLFCTPVVNLFQMDGSPLTMDQRQTEYRIVPDPRLPYHYATYSVDKVSAWGHDDRNRRRYLPFESFEHDMEGEGGMHAYYRLRLRPSPMDEDTETWISIVQTPGSGGIVQGETVSLELTCTNRLLPRQLRVGDICVHADNMPDSVVFSNITPVIPPFSPPLAGDMLWRLLSNMSLNYVSLTDVRALRAVLSAYDFRAPHDRQRARVLEKILRGMLRVHCAETDRIYGGLPVRGAQTRLVLDQRAFGSEGGMFIFGSVLNEFFALYATVNSFHQLILEEAARGEEYHWPARLGRFSL